MNIPIIYMIKAALYLAAFYLVYVLLLSRDTSYERNRIFIVLSVLLSMILPLITLHTSRPMDIQNFGKMLDEVFITASSEGTSASDSWFSGANTVKIIYLLYLTGTALLILKLLADLLNLFFLISRQKETGSRIIRFHSFNTAGFSAMGYIFLNSRLSDEELSEIIRHEENHLRRNHFVDIILIEAIKAFQWFNPAIYLLDRSLRAIHEFQADQECLKAGIPVVSYQTLLLNQVFRSKAFNLTNSFSNPSMIRKRMLMMTKKRTPSLANLKILLAIPAAGIIFLAISAYAEIPDSAVQNNISVTQTPANQTDNQLNQNIDTPDTEPYVQVEEMPVFPGGDEALIKFIFENTTYPERAKENNIQGRVILRFCINENGSVSRVSILSGVDQDLDAEAVRVVKALPFFIPGKQDGKAVPVWYMIPITFTLK
jgi:TonB family protein